MLPTLIYEPDAQNRAHILSLLSGCAEKCGDQFPVLLCTEKMGEAIRCAGGPCDFQTTKAAIRAAEELLPAEEEEAKEQWRL